MERMQQLLAEVLGAAPTGDPFTQLEAALTTCGIKVLLPAKATRVPIGKWHRVLKRGDHLLVREEGTNQVFHHAIFVGEKTLDGQLGPDDYVVDMFGD